MANFYIKELEDRYNNNLIDYKQYEKMRFLNVDRFIMGDDFYSDNAIVEDHDKYYRIIDGTDIKKINKKNKDISFLLENESGVIKK